MNPYERVLKLLANDPRAANDYDVLLKYIEELLPRIPKMTDKEIADHYYECEE